MNNKIGYLTKVYRDGGQLKAIFTEDLCSPYSLYLYLPELEKENNIEFEKRFAIYQNYANHQTKLFISYADAKEHTSSGIDKVEVNFIQEYKAKKLEIKKVPISEEITDQQETVNSIQNSVTLSFQFQKNALEQANNTSESLQEMRAFLKMMSSLVHTGRLVIEILEDGTEDYTYVLDYGGSGEPKRFVSKDLATLTFQILAFGESMRRRKEQQDE